MRYLNTYFAAFQCVMSDLTMNLYKWLTTSRMFGLVCFLMSRRDPIWLRFNLVSTNWCSLLFLTDLILTSPGVPLGWQSPIFSWLRRFLIYVLDLQWTCRQISDLHSQNKLKLNDWNSIWKIRRDWNSLLITIRLCQQHVTMQL